VRFRIVGLLAATGLLAACSPVPSSAEAAPISCASGEIAGQGSSAQANAVSAWIKNYQVSCADATVSYSSIGSGAGVTAFIGGTGDFAGSDSPVPAADQPKVAARCKGAAIHLRDRLQDRHTGSGQKLLDVRVEPGWPGSRRPGRLRAVARRPADEGGSGDRSPVGSTRSGCHRRINHSFEDSSDH
jgi:hypothetical protein